MISQDLKKYKLPDQPGVYFFLKGKKVLYVGKASSLRDRVRSYFAKDLSLTRGPKIEKMVSEVTKVKWQVTRSVLEALILEANLIKKYQPHRNTDGKDDKSFNFVVFTNEDFPIIKTVRGKDLLSNKLVPISYKLTYGPYPHGGELKEALKIIRRIFPYRDEKCLISKNKPCFNYQIGLCPGTCVGVISKKDYAKVIRSLKLLFEGKIDKLIKVLTRHMQRLAKELKFEEAGEFKKKIFALQHIQDVALLKRSFDKAQDKSHKNLRFEAYDVAHLSGQNVVGVMVVLENGELKKADYRKFKLHHSGDTANLKEILERRFKHRDWANPDLIVVDGSTAQINVAKKVLAQNQRSIPVVAVTKDERHRAREVKGASEIVRDYHNDIINLNAEAHRYAIAFHRRRRSL